MIKRKIDFLGNQRIKSNKTMRLKLNLKLLQGSNICIDFQHKGIEVLSFFITQQNDEHQAEPFTYKLGS